jgi:hypothetical protein
MRPWVTISQRFEFQDADSLSQFDNEWISIIRTFDDFAERDQRDDIATIDPLRLPVEYIFRLIPDDVSARLTISLPVNESAAATDGQDFPDNSFAEGE